MTSHRPWPGADKELIAVDRRQSERCAVRTGQAREAVLENRDVVVGRGDLTGQPRTVPGTAGTDRAGGL